MGTSIGLLVIATGPYVGFAADLLADLDRVLPSSRDVAVNLFTDAPPDALHALEQSHRVPVRAHPVPSLRWPEASLYRYELFAGAADRLVGESLVYLDADLRILGDFTPLVRPGDWPHEMAAVEHPGFYRPRRVRPRGTWETRKGSQAYVAPLRRRRYVCGGVWMGSRAGVLATSEELAGRIRTDAAAGLTARWHDESHWNWWVAHHETHLFDPRLCWVPDYPWLADLEPLVVAVDKGAGFRREGTATDVRRALEHPAEGRRGAE